MVEYEHNDDKPKAPPAKSTSGGDLAGRPGQKSVGRVLGEMFGAIGAIVGFRADTAVAEQEKKALVEEMRALVVQSEAKVPLAIAEAFKAGNLGIMDYARYRNIVSDTSMRESIAEAGEGDDGPVGG